MIETFKIKTGVLVGIVLLVLLSIGCQRPAGNTEVNVNTQRSGAADDALQRPTIEAAPVSDGDAGYKLITGENFKLSVRGPGASAAELFYQPVTADDRALLLKRLEGPPANGTFVADMKIPADFNGEVWARVEYQDRESQETEHLLLAKRGDEENVGTRERPVSPTGDDKDSNASENDTDESARSDSFTGGRVQHAALKPGDGDIRVTVNVPAFRLTVWQGGKEIKTAYVGVGRKSHPIPVGMRSAEKIILNPDWIPPDSAWVRKSSSVEPYERISADDPDNPLGKIKIPLGQAYLLHEAQSASDIGNLVSHGCVRVMRDDLFDITEMIAKARGLSISPGEIDAARKNTDRRVIDLNGSIPVDINYDTMVVENGVLTIYPDVYERNTNTVANLRAKLEQYGVDASRFDDELLKKTLGKVNGDQKFVVPISQIKNGNSLTGEVEPLTPQQAKKAQSKSK